MRSLEKSASALRDGLKVGLTRYPALYDLSRRPYAVARFYARRPHDPDYSVFGQFTGRRGVFLDVGANSGMSALSFRIYNRTTPIVSIEPNPYHERDLRFVLRLAAPLQYRMWAAGRASEMLDLYVPTYRGVPLTTEASLILDEVVQSGSLRARLGARMDTQAFSIVRRAVPVRPLDCLGLETAFIKLDVQGFEHDALLGLEETIQRSQPVMLIETPSEDVTRWLTQRGYSGFSYDPERRSLSPGIAGVTNALFVPAAR